MAKAISLIVLLALSACAVSPDAQSWRDPCPSAGETSIVCQDYRYSRMP